MPFGKIRNRISELLGKEEPEYIELDLGKEIEKKKVKVRHFILQKFEDVNDILNTLREGYTIAVIDIQPLRKKDTIELKRTISKIKKTADALEGDIKGFIDDIIIVTPSFAEISKPKKEQASKPKELY